MITVKAKLVDSIVSELNDKDTSDIWKLLACKLHMDSYYLTSEQKEYCWKFIQNFFSKNRDKYVVRDLCLNDVIPTPPTPPTLAPTPTISRNTFQLKLSSIQEEKINKLMKLSGDSKASIIRKLIDLGLESS